MRRLVCLLSVVSALVQTAAAGEVVGRGYIFLSRGDLPEGTARMSADDCDRDKRPSIPLADSPRFTGPVYVVTSDITVSAGETFSQMMTVLPNVTHAGTRTRGAFSDQSPVVLANCWRFAMPMELYVDPQGHPLEGRGLTPQVRIDLYPEGDLDHGHAKAVKALMRQLSH